MTSTLVAPRCQKALVGALMWLLATFVFSFDTRQIYGQLIRANSFKFYPKLIIDQANIVNAENNGKSIIIYGGLIRAAKNADEMAFILAHELSHGNLWHLGSTPRREYQADKVAVRYLRRAGFSVCRAVRILLLFNKRDSKTHPAGWKRYGKVSLGCVPFVQQ